MLEARLEAWISEFSVISDSPTFVQREPQLSREDSFKLLFLKFCQKSLCSIVLYEEETNMYVFPPVSDPADARFNPNLKYIIRVLNTKESSPIPTYFTLLVASNSLNHVTIVVETSDYKAVATATFQSDPRTVESSEWRDYDREMWSTFNTLFYRPMFSRVFHGKPILAARHSSRSSESSR